MLLKARLRHTDHEGNSTLATAVFVLEVISFPSGIFQECVTFALGGKQRNTQNCVTKHILPTCTV